MAMYQDAFGCLGQDMMNQFGRMINVTLEKVAPLGAIIHGNPVCWNIVFEWAGDMLRAVDDQSYPVLSHESLILGSLV